MYNALLAAHRSGAREAIGLYRRRRRRRGRVVRRLVAVRAPLAASLMIASRRAAEEMGHKQSERQVRVSGGLICLVGFDAASKRTRLKLEALRCVQTIVHIVVGFVVAVVVVVVCLCE